MLILSVNDSRLFLLMACICLTVLLAFSLRRQPQERVNPESRAELRIFFPLPQSHLHIQYTPFLAPFSEGARRQTTSLPNLCPVRSLIFAITSLPVSLPLQQILAFR